MCVAAFRSFVDVLRLLHDHGADMAASWSLASIAARGHEEQCVAIHLCIMDHGRQQFGFFTVTVVDRHLLTTPYNFETVLLSAVLGS